MKQKKSVVAMLALLSVAIVFFASYSYSAITAESPYLDGGETTPVIVIDAGHGGFDGGAVGVDGIVEKDINLSIATKLYDLFTINGFKAVLTRDSDTALNDEGLSGTRKKKNSDIHNRLEIAKSAENSILLSIHQNKFPQASSYGAQVFYGPKNPESQRLAEVMQHRLSGMLQPENKRQYKPCGDSVYLIHNAPMPSLLIECGFLSNPDDAYKLIDSTYQQKVAFTIFAGTMEYLGNEYQDLQNETGNGVTQNGGNKE